MTEDSEPEDVWKTDEWKGEYSSGPFLEESSFATLFPKYRETYIRATWPKIVEKLKGYGIAASLDCIEGSMTVKTTRKTSDPFILYKSRDMIRLLSRSVPFEQASRVLSDGIFSDVIKIKGMVRNKDRFVKRRFRLIGPNGATLKAIELLTKCYVMVQGNTIAAVGSIEGLKHVRRIVTGTMNNFHPIYEIKRLMIMRELENDPKLKGEDWSKFLPVFKKQNVKRKKRKIRVVKEPQLFPPPQLLRKEDLMLEQGDNVDSRARKRRKEKESKS